MKRGTGITTRQIKEAPKGAVFVWLNSHVDYPKRLARELGREDLDIVPKSRLTPDNWCGRRLTGVVVDHACQLDDRQWDVYQHIMRPSVIS
jgi:hypothetical protein